MMQSAFDLLGISDGKPADAPDYMKYIMDLFPEPKFFKERALKKFEPRPALFSQAALSARPEMSYIAGLQLTMLAPQNEAVEHQMMEMDAYLNQIIAYAPRSTKYYQYVKTWEDRRIDEPVIAVDLETDGLDRRVMYDWSGDLIVPTKIVGLCLGVSSMAGYYLPTRHTGDDGVRNWHPSVITHALNRLFTTCIALIHNAQYDLFISQLNGVTGIRQYPGFVDTQQLAFFYDVNEKSNGLKTLAAKLLKRKMVKIEELFGETKKDAVVTFNRICASDAYIYGCLDGTNTFALFEFLVMSPIMPLRNQAIVSHIDHELTNSLIDMYKSGMPIDYDYNMLALHDCVARAAMLREFIYEELAQKFDIESPKQLSEIIYDRLGVQPLAEHELGKKKARGTDEETLEILAERNPHITGLLAIVDYRKISTAAGKLHAKFVSNCYLDSRDPVTRVNVDFNQTNVPTGRLSSASGSGRPGVFTKFAKDDVTIKEQVYFKGDYVWGGNSQGIGNPPQKKYKLKRIVRNASVDLSTPYSPETKMAAARKVADFG